MPNNAHHWTQTEEKAALEMTWEEFDNKFNGRSGSDISYDAFRLRKAKLKKEGLVPMDDPIEIPSTDEKSFVGVTTAYYDLETTYSSQPRVLWASIADSFGNIERFSLTDPRYAGSDWLDDSVLVDKFARRLEEYDHAVSWNGKLFDVPTANGRLNYWRVLRDRQTPTSDYHVREDLSLKPLNIHTHTDLMYYASGQFNRIGRRSLESVSTFFNSPHKKTPLDVRIWDKADHGDMDAYALIGEHCDADVLVLRDVYSYLKPHVRNIHR